MANPQKENGYTPIANDIQDAFSRTRIPGEVRQILDFILRKTYGWDKPHDDISLSQFVIGTGLKKTTICKGIKRLKDMNLILTQLGNTGTTNYRLNKDFESWKLLPKKVIVTQLGTYNNNIYIKEKSNYTKEIFPDYLLVKLSKEEYEKLVVLMGEEKVGDYIEKVFLYCKSRGKKYKDYYATILAWNRKDNKDDKSKDSKVYLRDEYNPFS